jgi:hypothetical protein
MMAPARFAAFQANESGVIDADQGRRQGQLFGQLVNHNAVKRRNISHLSIDQIKLFGRREQTQKRRESSTFHHNSSMRNVILVLKLPYFTALYNLMKTAQER